ncbi:MAG: acetyl-CoA carboxylase, biotin carboxyl carrier protein [Gemmataceae bacterium]|nr:acetyl-CoA carboxylase, biotin carboxyl carrier protein [Gemmataceae bacterium]
MSVHDLAEVDLIEGDERIRLRKGSAFARPAAPAPVYPAAPPPGAHAPGSPPPSAPPPPAGPPAKKLLEIKSELVGAFYTRPAPDKPEFVRVGSKVAPDTTVCLVIAMKVNNEIKAGVSGTIAEVVARNEDFVDFDTVLFRVEPA